LVKEAVMRVVPVEEIKGLIGQVTGTSDWFEIDQARINAFADATVDHQWIHVDEAAAAKGPIGSTIAHGFLTLSLLPNLAAAGTVVPEGMVMALNYGANNLRFLAPVPVGSRIRAVSTLKDFNQRSPDRYLITVSVVVEIEGSDTPALVVEALTLAVMGESA
jgi:acyl dehydratase